MNEMIFDLPEEKYFAARAASNSVLGLLMKTPLHAKYLMDNPPEPTPSIIMGKLAHTLVLEPEEFNNRYHIKHEDDPTTPRKQVVLDLINAIEKEELSEKFYIDDGSVVKKPIGVASEIVDHLNSGGKLDDYVVDPEISKRTKQGKEDHAKFVEANKDKTIVKQKQMDQALEYKKFLDQLNGRTIVSEKDLITAKNYLRFTNYIGDKTIVTKDQYEHGLGMAEAIKSHPTATKLLRSGKSEVSLSWIDPDTGMQCKARIDRISDLDYLIDVKSTTDASEYEFARSISKYGYHRQDAFYLDGFREVTGRDAKAFIFIAVESKPPYAVNCFCVDPSSREQGRSEYKTLLNIFKHCTETGDWYGYDEKVKTIELPPYHRGI